LLKVPAEYKRLHLFTDVQKIEATNFSKTSWKKFINGGGDIIEAIAGAVNVDCIEGREFCKWKGISDTDARRLRSGVSALSQHLSQYLSAHRSENFTVVLSALRQECLLKDFSLVALEDNTADVAQSSSNPQPRLPVNLQKRNVSQVATSSSSPQTLPANMEADDTLPVQASPSNPETRLPRPQRHPEDTRFEYKHQNRVVYCDGSCGSAHKKDRFNIDGCYVYQCPGSSDIEPAAARYAFQAQAHAAGTWDATWLCSSCWKDKLFNEKLLNYSIEQTRAHLGIAQSRDHEIKRRCKRTQADSRR
jgi:hypothetical protein